MIAAERHEVALARIIRACARSAAGGLLRPARWRFESACRRPPSNPGRYQNHSVSIDGVVTSSWGVPLVAVPDVQGRRRHRGSHCAVAEHADADARGARARERARSNDVAVLGGQALGLHLREESLYVKGN